MTLNLVMLLFGTSHSLTEGKLYSHLNTLKWVKTFGKALKTEKVCFKCLIVTFPGLSFEQIKAGVGDGPKIWQLVKNYHFYWNYVITWKKKNAGSLKDLIENLHGNKRSKSYTETVHELMEDYKMLACNISIELHFLKSHIPCFPESLGEASDEQG